MRAAAASLGLCALLLYAAQEVHAQEGEPSNAIVWNEAAPRKSIELRRVVSRIPKGQPVGEAYNDLLCISERQPISMNISGDLNPNEYAPLLNAELAAAGYPHRAAAAARTTCCSAMSPWNRQRLTCTLPPRLTLST